MTTECESQVPKGLTPEEWHLICRLRREKEQALWYNKGLNRAATLLEVRASAQDDHKMPGLAGLLRQCAAEIRKLIEVPSALP